MLKNIFYIYGRYYLIFYTEDSIGVFKLLNELRFNTNFPYYAQF